MQVYLCISFNLVNFFKPTHGIDATKVLMEKGVPITDIHYETVTLLETKNGDVTDYYIAMILSSDQEIMVIVKNFLIKYATQIHKESDFEDALDKLDYQLPRSIEDYFHQKYTVEDLDKGVDLYVIETSKDEMERVILASKLLHE